ncbi:Vesicle transport protein [Paragonimus heterotremus]|uniref:Vesicle transport protein n=1 Tax=Paragonimus heterotremus TaxID=100268 RepID=A0A8J4TMT4_9TREM|nr:Vesicle transport protein [Paragonimus heterotremus]
MDKLRTVFSPQEDEQGILSSVESSFNLSWSTRIKGFIFCFVIGILLSLLGAMFLWVPVKGLILFALFYTLGNVFSIGSTIFLMGPANQCKRMFQETRIFAAVFMFVCMALTICSAVWVTKNSDYNLPFPVAQQTVVSYLLHHAIYLAYLVFAFIYSVCKGCSQKMLHSTHCLTATLMLPTDWNVPELFASCSTHS